MVRFIYPPKTSLFTLSPVIIFVGGRFVSPVCVVVIVCYPTAVTWILSRKKGKLICNFILIIFILSKYSCRIMPEKSYM